MSSFRDHTCLFLTKVSDMMQTLLDHHDEEVADLRRKAVSADDPRGSFDEHDVLNSDDFHDVNNGTSSVSRKLTTSFKRRPLCAKLAVPKQSTGAFDDVIPSESDRHRKSSLSRVSFREIATTRATFGCSVGNVVDDVLNENIQSQPCRRMIRNKTCSESALAATRVSKSCLKVGSNETLNARNLSISLVPTPQELDNESEPPASPLSNVKPPIYNSQQSSCSHAGDLTNPAISSTSVESPFAEVFLPRKVWDVEDTVMKSLTRKSASNPRSQSNVSTASAQFSTQSSTSKEIETEKRSRQKRALNPQSRAKLVWDILAVVVLLYDLVVIPLQAFDLPANDAAVLIDVSVLVYWTMDTVVSAITGRYINGKLELRLEVILRRYLKTWFLFDISLIIPEWLMIMLDGDGDQSPLGLVRVFKGVRFARLARLLRLLRLVKMGKMFEELSSRINSNLVLLSLNVIKMMLGITILIHILACAWYFVGKQSDDGWVRQNGVHLQDFGYRYLFTFQFSMARLHPSTFGTNLSFKTVSERLLSIIVSLCALGGGGVFISSITNTMALLEAHRTMRTRKLAIVREYVKENHISTSLAVRTKKYVEESVDRKLREQNAADLVSLVPSGLLAELHREAWSPTICNHHQFRLLSVNHPKTLCNLCNQAFREIVANASELVFGVCDPCTCMFFIRAGELRYSQLEELSDDCSPEGTESIYVEEKILPGQWLSEPSLWTRWENQGNLKPAKDSTILVLHMEPFVIEIQSHERVLVEIADYCKRFIQCMNMLRDLSDNLPPSFAQEEPAEEPAQRQWSLFRKPSTLSLGSVLPQDADASGSTSSRGAPAASVGDNGTVDTRRQSFAFKGKSYSLPDRPISSTCW
eukprot:TRINITY_DN2944_c0_g1_i3.p1 TRINITY_DN2944_c0_g1~~TRINITY_DN2944_c0_g1_i3.p1  ORF type:complete len:902 (-),score=114.34 TRINITY_DN2944_c0_g1_i3:217-2826(-)